MVLLLLTPGVAFADLAGKAAALDGDTLAIGGQEVSLHGIDAPPIGQSCGEGEGNWLCGWDAADRLEEFIADREVVCVEVARSDSDEISGLCTVDGEDLGGMMVDEGLAIITGEGGEDYRERELAAADSGTGLWSGSFADPSNWDEPDSCSCTARKQAMLETAEALKAQRASQEEEAAE